MSRKIVFLIAGEGGHYEQARRLYSNMANDLPNEIIVLTDVLNKKINPELTHFELGNFRGKDGFTLMEFTLHLKSIYSVIKPLISGNEISVISTGPGIAIVPSLIVKFFGGKIVHVETWSRFYSKSGAGKIMYHLADKFYVQNKELLELYPKAVYSGRL